MVQALRFARHPANGGWKLFMTTSAASSLKAHAKKSVTPWTRAFPSDCRRRRQGGIRDVITVTVLRGGEKKKAGGF